MQCVSWIFTQAEEPKKKQKTNSPNITDGTNETVKLDTTTALTLCFCFCLTYYCYEIRGRISAMRGGIRIGGDVLCRGVLGVGERNQL